MDARSSWRFLGQGRGKSSALLITSAPPDSNKTYTVKARLNSLPSRDNSVAVERRKHLPAISRVDRHS